ncbi:hypothetical protein VD0002_g7050 [Verticillium dahliae]|uniref:Uncharacterized protein n=1 Tax=Verticillium dahliae TaxID=27337 RepID=A0A2J8DBW0_VERDA|nr:hypothetical protein BJF96_g3997 [Verticillium dahliae]PNH38818.1 hypothetical protein VD0004_g8034 [Verticillium dahliae]PNH46756.1 hypothetical protein VD0003_g8961 [Verticillium dahliae]PNH60612.1 hypothetical protein VD0002_g7050 [Verticillium dahliae]PNH76399.1 hypothetical protein VD0001_g1221 [Verticillium dahliae]
MHPPVGRAAAEYRSTLSAKVEPTCRPLSFSKASSPYFTVRPPKQAGAPPDLSLTW